MVDKKCVRSMRQHFELFVQITIMREPNKASEGAAADKREGTYKPRLIEIGVRAPARLAHANQQASMPLGCPYVSEGGSRAEYSCYGNKLQIEDVNVYGCFYNVLPENARPPSAPQAAGELVKRLYELARQTCTDKQARQTGQQCA